MLPAYHTLNVLTSSTRVDNDSFRPGVKPESDENVIRRPSKISDKLCVYFHLMTREFVRKSTNKDWKENKSSLSHISDTFTSVGEQFYSAIFGIQVSVHVLQRLTICYPRVTQRCIPRFKNVVQYWGNPAEDKWLLKDDFTNAEHLDTTLHHLLCADPPSDVWLIIQSMGDVFADGRNHDSTALPWLRKSGTWKRGIQILLSRTYSGNYARSPWHVFLLHYTDM